MTLTPVVVLALLLWAGLCAADQRALGSRQIHQPIVAAVGAGLILHAPERALLVGMWLQLVWVAPMPVGGVILPDTGSAAVAAALVAAIVPGPAGLGLAILFGLLVGTVSIPWERSLRAVNGRRETAALNGTQSGVRVAESAAGTRRAHPDDTPGLGRAILLGIAGPFARGVACAGASIVLCIAVMATFPSAFFRPVSTTLTLLIERALLGGAACIGLAGLLLSVRPQNGRASAAWTAGGVILGLAGGILLRGRG